MVSRGPDRFADVAATARALIRDRLAAEPVGLPAGAGPVWMGGFAFAPDGGSDPHWSSLPPALLVLPEVSLARDEGRTLLTVTRRRSRPARHRESALGRVAPARRVPPRRARCPMLDPAPTGEVRSRAWPTRVRSRPRSRGRWSGSAAASSRRWCWRGRSGRRRHAGARPRRAVRGALRELFPSCFCFCVGTPEAAFLGASPELLVRRRGAGAQTVALAGSTRRSADPAVDDHLGEQLRRSAKNRLEHEIVVRRIERALRPHSVWVETGGEPVLIKVANIQHLATPIHAQLADAALGASSWPGSPPDPGDRRRAVGARRSRRSPSSRRMDRGWYAGAVGWMDATEDGEFCVGIRSALLRDRTAHVFAGNGIVADSDPAEELAETELKLGALLPLLAG